MVNMDYLVSSVVTGVQEKRSTKILEVNVYRVAPPGGGRGYYDIYFYVGNAEVKALFTLVNLSSSSPLQLIELNPVLATESRCKSRTPFLLGVLLQHLPTLDRLK